MFFKLPIELRSKIMYSGYIVHPVAKIMKDLIDCEKELWQSEINLDNLESVDFNFYEYLVNVNFFNIIGLTMEEIEELIFSVHIFIDDDFD